MKFLNYLQRYKTKVQTKDIIVQPSCSLLHTPIDKTEETHLSTELFDALAFANQKLEELVLIHSALTQGTESISNELETYRNITSYNSFICCT